MDPNAPILDYASPRKRGKLRMPARSTLVCRIESDIAVVEESLKGKSEAISAIAFACITLTVTLAQMIAEIFFRHFYIDTVITLAILAATQLLVMLLVIHQTWRKTVLTVQYNQVQLAFNSPLMHRHYDWTSGDIADIVMVQTGNSLNPVKDFWTSNGIAMVPTANVDSSDPLAELLITRTAGGDVHLFTDHYAEDIRPLIRALPLILRNGHLNPLPVE